MAQVLHRELTIKSCQGGRIFTNTFSSNLKIVNLNIFPNYGGISIWRKSPDQFIELWKYLSWNLIVIIKKFQRSFFVQFHVDPDLDILFEKLTTQIGALLGLRTQLQFETCCDLRVNIVKMHQLTLG